MIVTTPTPPTSHSIKHNIKNIPSTITQQSLDKLSPSLHQIMNPDNNIEQLKATLEDLKRELNKSNQIECASLKAIQQQLLNHLITKVQSKILCIEQKQN